MGRRVVAWLCGAAVFSAVAVLAALGLLPSLDDADKLASVISAAVGLAALAVAVQSLRLERRNGGGGPPDDDPARRLLRALGELTEAVREQWQAEAATRGIGDNDRLLALRWSARAASVLSGPPDVRVLDGSEQVVAAYRAAGARRLVIVGDAGSGKSALAVLLTRGLAERRTDAEPAPVYLSLASWNPEVQGLRAWLARRLAEDYPFLRSPARFGTDMPARLVQRRGALLVVLDGLDEIPAAARVRALREIERADLADLVLTCRRDEYEEALRSGGVTVAGAAQATIEPLTVGDLDLDFFTHGYAPLQAQRWIPVLDRIQRRPQGRLARTLRTPLMVSLARDVYQHPDRDPAELIRPNAFPTEESIERHLAHALIPALFRPPADDERRGPWDGRDAERWLRYLAVALPPDQLEIRWWELSRLARTSDRVLSATFSALAIGPAIGLGFQLLWGPWAGLAIGGVFALVMAWAAARTLPPPSALYFGRLRKLWAPLMGGLEVGAVAVIVCSIREGPEFGVPAGLFLGVPVGFVYVWAAPDATVRTVTPRGLLYQDIWVALVFGIIYGVTTGGVVGFAVDPLYGAAFGLFCGLSGAFFYGPVWLLAFRVDNVGVIAWVHYTFARLALAPRRRLPWRTLAFLEEAHRRGALRQVGAVYEFRHQVVRDALAARPHG
ncbi:NACHT domain-containing protein [Spirillospora sp. CA-294931]|uniref:NACHT domain-containing protein n=1 Tax=Spirillospora sp. CA-294931 TaxID=3240042 RepID=UPI003D923057